MKPKVIAIVGPTASGKSALGNFLATKLSGEVIAADSRQVYKGMRVISRAERGHMVGVADPRKQYSAGAYQKAAERILRYIVVFKKKVPIVVGGTGFYADALLRVPLPQVAPNATLRTTLAKKTPMQLLAMLKKLDPKSAARVDPKNIVRLVRAIEIVKALGKIPAPIYSSPYTTLWLGLPNSKNLTAGVEARLKAGMVAEAKKLRRTLSKKRYKELGFEFDLLADYIDKKITKQQLVERIANSERKYAKRQSKWFKRYKDIHWVKNKTEALKLSKTFLQ